VLAVDFLPMGVDSNSAAGLKTILDAALSRDEAGICLYLIL
jgi:hypothetical protein